MPTSERMKAALGAAEERLAKARSAADVYAERSGLTGVCAHLLVGVGEILLAVVLDDEDR